MINQKIIKHLAKLSRLELEEKEIKKYQKQLEKILDYVKKIKNIEENIEPTYQTIDLVNILREDKTIERWNNKEKKEKILNQAPEKNQDYFKTKKLL